MNGTNTIIEVTDRTIGEVLAAERAILILAKTTCANCRAYQADIEARLARGEFEGFTIARLYLDRPGAPRFKQANPWIARLEFVPYTLLYRNGEIVDQFAASKGSYLVERVEEAFGEQAAAEARAA